MPFLMNKTRILIVEDEAIVAEDIRQQMVNLGYEPVACTARGEEAILLAERLRPDLVLMGIRLAGEMDGVAAAQAIRERFALGVVFLAPLPTRRRCKERNSPSRLDTSSNRFMSASCARPSRWPCTNTRPKPGCAKATMIGLTSSARRWMDSC